MEVQLQTDRTSCRTFLISEFIYVSRFQLKSSSSTRYIKASLSSTPRNQSSSSSGRIASFSIPLCSKSIQLYSYQDNQTVRRSSVGNIQQQTMIKTTAGLLQLTTAGQQFATAGQQTMTSSLLTRQNSGNNQQPALNKVNQEPFFKIV